MNTGRVGVLCTIICMYIFELIKSPAACDYRFVIYLAMHRLPLSIPPSFPLFLNSSFLFTIKQLFTCFHFFYS